MFGFGYSKTEQPQLSRKTLNIIRRPGNVISDPSAFDAPSWRTINNLETFNISPNAAKAPDGTMTADTLTMSATPQTGSVGFKYQPVPLRGPGLFTIWLQGHVGGEKIALMESVDGVNFESIQYTLTPEWTEYSLTYDVTEYVMFGVDIRDARQLPTLRQTIDIWLAQLTAR